jgi:DNA-binding IclR family transcriptional regulator
MVHNDNSNAAPQTDTGVKAVDTTLYILDALQRLEGAKVTAIADETSLSKGAVYKHLATLMKHGFVVKDDEEYHLGFKFLDYGGWLRSRFTGSRIIKSKVQDLADETSEVALFGTLENARVITLFRENGTHGVSTRTRLGRQMYPNQTASGKAILSQVSPERVTDIFETTGLPQATENTITDEETFCSELETIRERGYALNLEESTSGLVAVAVPLAPANEVIGACSVAGPRHRMNQERLDNEIAPLLLGVVNELELNIAHPQRSGSERGFD